MACMNRTVLLEVTALTAANTSSPVRVLELLQTDFAGWLHVSANDGATTVTANIQHSADGTNWVDVGTFATVVNTTGVKSLNITAHLFPHVRCNVALSGVTTSATALVVLYHDKKR